MRTAIVTQIIKRIHPTALNNNDFEYRAIGSIDFFAATSCNIIQAGLYVA